MRMAHSACILFFNKKNFSYVKTVTDNLSFIENTIKNRNILFIIRTYANIVPKIVKTKSLINIFEIFCYCQLIIPSSAMYLYKIFMSVTFMDTCVINRLYGIDARYELVQ